MSPVSMPCRKDFADRLSFCDLSHMGSELSDLRRPNGLRSCCAPLVPNPTNEKAQLTA
jgi:hypothetical protein